MPFRPRCTRQFASTGFDGPPPNDLRIHVARSRHIILVERGRSGNSFLGMEIISHLGAESDVVYDRHLLTIISPSCPDADGVSSDSQIQSGLHAIPEGCGPLLQLRHTPSWD